ncbi:HTH-type transcriptional regulator UlaR [Psittacicella gerlachiana]|uniref:HTH deoR-type domain-containing protein n=1 Tax=Psittacicella gerlachiana TaxID=2028574 RepID=A0A3A1YCQ5_9GAMM|nr:HTH-type transcriptional regulator UlaR [Psittacicella gerlachiana]RIY35321.1 hypothetical protein CKF59_03785 [Psittacicella gerlachiana]
MIDDNGLINKQIKQEQLVDELNKRKVMSVTQVAEFLEVAEVTARRYINSLDKEGRLMRVRNGCQCLSKYKVKGQQDWNSFNVIDANNYDEKVRIAKAAASLCQDNDSIIINCGSTAFLLGQELIEKNVQVITNYLPLLNFLIEKHQGNTIVIGGQYYPERNLFITNETSSAQSYAGKYMFTSGSGLTEQGLFKNDLLSLLAEQKFIPQVQKLVCLVDSDKVGQRIGSLFASAKNIHIVITGREANRRVIASLQAQGINVILV